MTALPATRADAMKFVDGACGVCGPVDLNTWLGLIALARRGAETVGATEFTEIKAIVAMSGTVNFDPVRRCLILPDES